MKTKSILTFLVLSIFFSVVFAQPSQNEFSSKLLPLVGKKVILTLKDGEVVEGTLWDFEADYIILKIKKSLIYSQSVKYNIDKLNFLEDQNGTKISFVKESKPTAIFFSMDDTQNEGDYSENYNLTQESKNDNGLEITTSTIQKSAEAQRKKSEVTQNKPFVKKVYRTRPKNSKKINQTTSIAKKKTVKKSKPVKKSNAITQAALSEKNEVPQHIRPRKQKISAFTKVKISPSNITKKRSAGVPAKLEDTEVLLAGVKEVRVLRYQLLILFAVVGILALVMITAKTIGLKGSTYGKHTLFPSKLIKIEGHYGIIDQGTTDGVKLDDIIRFYRKKGQKIEYRGQVQVKKVGEAESAVEILKAQKGKKLEIGDVGFRDHNMLATAMKKLRVVTSIVLNFLGKTIIYTAKNIEIKEQEPDIKLDSENETKSKVKIVKQTTPKTGERKPVKAAKNGKTTDFSVQNN